jgi:hypothetical protein
LPTCWSRAANTRTANGNLMHSSWLG